MLPLRIASLLLAVLGWAFALGVWVLDSDDAALLPAFVFGLAVGATASIVYVMAVIAQKVPDIVRAYGIGWRDRDKQLRREAPIRRETAA